MKEKIQSLVQAFQRFVQAFKMNGEVKKRTLIIGGIVVLAIVVIIVLAICLKPAQNNVEPPVEDPIEEVEPDYSDRVEPEPIEEPATMQEIFEKYPDVHAWIEIPGTSAVLDTPADVSYPVAQHPSVREYYLHRDLDGNTNKEGTLFTENYVAEKYINSRDLSDPVTIIYGHNMANRTMFGGLQTYLSKMDFSKENIIRLYQPGRRVTYQIVGGVQYDLSHIIYYHDFNDPQVFDDFFTQLWKETDPTTNLDGANKPVAGDKVLILSVCKNGDDNHRYLIVSKMIEDTADPETWAVSEDAAPADAAQQAAE